MSSLSLRVLAVAAAVSTTLASSNDHVVSGTSPSIYGLLGQLGKAGVLSKTLRAFEQMDIDLSSWAGQDFLAGRSENFPSGPLPKALNYTLLAPTDTAWAKLPQATVDQLFDINNRQQLIQVLSYHVIATTVDWSQTQDGTVFTMGNSQPTIFRTDPEVTCGGSANSPALFGGGDSCVAIRGTGTRFANNGEMILVDSVLLPPWLPPPFTKLPIDPGCCETRCKKLNCPCYDPAKCAAAAAARDNQELWFRAIVNITYDWTHPQTPKTFQHCGQVDAAPSMPPSILKNPQKLKAYVAATLKLLKVRGESGGLWSLERGKCSDVGFTKPAGDQRGLMSEESVIWGEGFPLMDSVCEQDGLCGCHIGECPTIAPDGNCTFGFGPTKRGGTRSQVRLGRHTNPLSEGIIGRHACPEKQVCTACGGSANVERTVVFYCPPQGCEHAPPNASLTAVRSTQATE